MLQILCKTPAAIFKIQIPANTKSKFNRSKAAIDHSTYVNLNLSAPATYGQNIVV